MQTVLVGFEVPVGILAFAVLTRQLTLATKKLGDGWHGELCHHIFAADMRANDPRFALLNHVAPTSFLNSDPSHAIRHAQRDASYPHPGA